MFVPAGDNACTTGALGTCIVTINSPTAGTTVVEANWAGGTVEGAVISAKTTQPDASKTWVKVRISITPLQDANEAGTNHDLTITLEKSVVENVWTPLANENVTASLTNSNGATAVFVPAGDDACTTGALGTCIVTINSPTAGTTVVEANWAGGTVEGAVISAKTTQPDASKTWVKVRISITPLQDANEAGTNHDLTITLEKSVVENVWTPLANENVTASLTNSNGATAVFVPAGDNACTTGALGTCIVTINSPTAGTTVVEANWAGGTVEGAVISAKTTQPDASKTWVKVRISITPLQDANEAGTNHDLTITLEKSVVENVWTPLANENVTASLTNSNGATAVFVPAGDNACTRRFGHLHRHHQLADGGHDGRRGELGRRHGRGCCDQRQDHAAGRVQDVGEGAYLDHAVAGCERGGHQPRPHDHAGEVGGRERVDAARERERDRVADQQQRCDRGVRAGR